VSQGFDSRGFLTLSRPEVGQQLKILQCADAQVGYLPSPRFLKRV
jgi:hypothetical protein